MAWAGDITFIWTAAGWVYLALLIDLCTRRIVGWATSTRCDTALALRALNNAVARHQPPPGLLHHTDRGSTYASHDYRKRLETLGMIASMSRVGNCWDNSVAESTIGTIKIESIDGSIPASQAEVNTTLFSYIEGFFNPRRLHSSLGFVSPNAYEALFTQERRVA
jgi:transposase InsO family protein